jgi:hypothetical protein
MIAGGTEMSNKEKRSCLFLQGRGQEAGEPKQEHSSKREA